MSGVKNLLEIEYGVKECVNFKVWLILTKCLPNRLEQFIFLQTVYQKMYFTALLEKSGITKFFDILYSKGWIFLSYFYFPNYNLDEFIFINVLDIRFFFFCELPNFFLHTFTEVFAIYSYWFVGAHVWILIKFLLFMLKIFYISLSSQNKILIST